MSIQKNCKVLYQKYSDLWEECGRLEDALAERDLTIEELMAENAVLADKINLEEGDFNVQLKSNEDAIICLRNDLAA